MCEIGHFIRVFEENTRASLPQFRSLLRQGGAWVPDVTVAPPWRPYLPVSNALTYGLGSQAEIDATIEAWFVRMDAGYKAARDHYALNIAPQAPLLHPRPAAADEWVTPPPVA